MMSLFHPRLPIDDEELEFQLATFQWLIAEFGPVTHTPLVLPTAEFFPSAAMRGGSRAAELFEDVRKAAGMAGWPCRLEPGDAGPPIDAGNDHLLQSDGSSAPCGTFSFAEGPDGTREGLITYNPDMERDQAGLVATFAHELGHYLIGTGRMAGPGGWDLHELHTDLAAVYLGFGIFLANGARAFEVFQGTTRAGWSSRIQGYLSEGALVTATTIFQHLKGRDPLEAAPYLKHYLRKDLRRAHAALRRRHPDMAAAVAAVDLDAFRRD